MARTNKIVVACDLCGQHTLAPFKTVERKVAERAGKSAYVTVSVAISINGKRPDMCNQCAAGLLRAEADFIDTTQDANHDGNTAPRSCAPGSRSPYEAMPTRRRW